MQIKFDSLAAWGTAEIEPEIQACDFKGSLKIEISC